MLNSESIFHFGLIPTYQFISRYLESYTLAHFHTLLNGNNFSLISYAIGTPTLAFPSLFLSFFVALFSSPLVSIIVNLFLFSASIIIFSKVFFKTFNWKLRVFLLVSIILSPWLWDTVIYSTDICLVFLFTSIYYLADRNITKLFSLLILVISSPISWLLVPFMILSDFYKHKQFYSSLFQVILSVFLIGFLLTRPLVIKTYFPIFIPETHGYLTQIHRQADLVSGNQLLGKLLYNKYVVIVQQLINQVGSYIDWDRYVFIGNSGKSNGLVYDYPQFSLFELPFIIVGIIYLFTTKNSKEKQLLFFTVGTLISASITTLSSDPGALYWLALFLVSFAVFIKLYSHNQNLFILIISLVIITKIANLNLLIVSRKNNHRACLSYYQVSQLIGKTSGRVIFTDQVGQPHIYLTFFGSISPEVLMNSLQETKSLDKDFLTQPAEVGRFRFGTYSLKTLEDYTQEDSSLLVVTSQQIKDSSLIGYHQSASTNSFNLKVGDKDMDSKFIILTPEE